MLAKPAHVDELSVKPPMFPDCVTETVCAAPAPVAKNERLLGDARTAPGAGVGVGVAGTGVGVAGTGVGVAGTGVGVAGTGVGVAGTGVGVAGTGVGVAGTGVGVAGTGVGVGGTSVGVGVGTGLAGGEELGVAVGDALGVAEARALGLGDGTALGLVDGDGLPDALAVGDVLGLAVGLDVAATVVGGVAGVAELPPPLQATNAHGIAAIATMLAMTKCVRRSCRAIPTNADGINFI